VNVKKIYFIAAALVASYMLGGCMSTGVEVKPEQTSDFRQGVTTRAEVLGRLGTPTTQATMPDGSTMLIYSFAASQARPASFIPLVGAFAGGADARSSMVEFVFTPDGVLKSSSSSTSQSGSQMGTTTTNQSIPTDQPRKVQ
jgi:outer membrane protein assembly factor BamE (lipoprotein component of BamABCDE complex)